jgi:hypothetical protein
MQWWIQEFFFVGANKIFSLFFILGTSKKLWILRKVVGLLNLPKICDYCKNLFVLNIFGVKFLYFNAKQWY